MKVPIFVLATLLTAGCGAGTNQITPSTRDMQTKRYANLVERLPDPHVGSPLAETADARCQTLRNQVTAYLRDNYVIDAQRFFRTEMASFQWIVIYKNFASALHDSGLQTTREDIPWHNPGFDLVGCWRVDSLDGKYLAIAALDPGADRKSPTVMGYFELTKKVPAP